LIAKIPLTDTALSTSGDYERYFDEGGSVTITSSIPVPASQPARCAAPPSLPDGVANRWSVQTAFVLGPDAAMKIYNQLPGVDVILVSLDGKVLYSEWSGAAVEAETFFALPEGRPAHNAGGARC
jgi:thiamine biosynthesis lipoprotein